MRRLPTTLAASAAGVVLLCARPALAHAGESTGPHDELPALGLFLIGACVLGASAYLDARAAVDRRFADVGVFAGLAAVITSVLLYGA